MEYTIVVNQGHLSESEYDTYKTKREAVSMINNLVNENCYEKEQLSIVINERSK